MPMPNSQLREASSLLVRSRPAPATTKKLISGMVIILWLAAAAWGAQPDLSGSISLDLVFPAGYRVNTVAVAANGQLVLGSGDQIIALDGSPGTVVNAGNGPLNIGDFVNAGAAVSVGNIIVGQSVSVATVESAGSVTLGARDSIGNVKQGATLTPLVHRNVSVNIPTNAPTDVFVTRGETRVLLPGRYSQLKLAPGGAIILSAGTYVVDDFLLEPSATVQLDTIGGTVNLFAANSAVWKGDLSGDPLRLVFGLLGSGTMLLEGPFRGTALAPGGTMKLAFTSTPYYGTFYAHNVVIDPNVTIHELATPFLFDGITVSSTTPCVGDPVEVKVTSANAAPNTTVWIQGIVGSRQILQFRDAAGPRTVYATAFTPNGPADFTAIPITLQHCTPQPGALLPLALHFWHGLRKPNVIELTVHDFDDKGHEVSVSGPTTYSWTFGDGQTATTSSPLVSHDYTAAIDPLAEYSYFEVSVSATTARGKATARKIVPIWSLYAKNRAKGIIQPLTSLAHSGSNMTLTVQNYEATPISITQANVELIPCDPSLDARPQSPLRLAVTIPAHTATAVSIAMPAAIPTDVCSIGAHLLGNGDTRIVYADGYETLRENRFLVKTITDPNTLKTLNLASTLTKDPNQFDEFELRELQAQGSIPPLALPLTEVVPAVASRFRALDLQSSTTPKVGDACNPGDTTPTGLVCGPTTGWAMVGPEFLNAFKGNFIMDHGCGKIGQLLSAVHQLFSHTSTMVTNRTEVRHSTASSDRMNSNVDYLAERLDPDTLQFGFPGTAGPSQRYTIEQMVSQYLVTDPVDAGKKWTMGGELSPNPSSCANDTTAVQPVVVRPAPDAPASVLAGVTTVVDHTDINSHYRFVNYSRADLLPGAAWARGTESTVCSSFDRLAAVRAGLALHPSIAKAGVPDGMRQYSVDERTAAANALYSQVSNDVGDACSPTTVGAILGGAGYLLGGPIGGVIGGVVGAEYCNRMIGNVANQVNNCFASDGCSNTSSDWHNPGTGIAVSPDDMLDWDTWRQGGTYGYNEPLRYKATGYRRAYVWSAAAGSGSMTVRVVHTNMTPYANATILLNTNPVGSTDSNGVFNIPTLAQGKYEVGAQFDPCAATGHPAGCNQPLEQANLVKVLPPGGSVDVTLVLCAGPVVAGVVTSCAQPGVGPRFTHVGIEFGPEKYLLCIFGAGFEVGGPVVPVTLSGSGGFFKGPLPGTGLDINGGFFTSTVIDRVFNTGFNCSGNVTITAFDALADVAIQSTVPASYFCAAGHTLPDFNNGCKP